MERQAEPGSAILARNVVALAVVATWSILAWHSLIALVAHARVYLSSLGAAHEMLLPLVWLAIYCVAALCVIRYTGLLALVRRPATAQASGSDWWRWLAHFKLSLAALLLTCLAAWLARDQLLRSLVAGFYPPEARAYEHLYFSSPTGMVQTEALIVTAAAWTVALPFMASDAWGLLLPQVAARLRVPFALATGLVAWGVLAIVLRYAPGWAGGLWRFA